MKIHPLILISVAVTVLRFFIEPRFNLPTLTGCYETLAHMFFGACVVFWYQEFDTTYPYEGRFFNRFFWIGMVPAITELVMFIIQKGARHV